MVHFAPRARVDPWFDLHGTGLGAFLSLKKWNASTNSFDSVGAFGGATLAGAKLGLDIHPLESYRAFAVAPYAQFNFALIGGFSKDNISSEDKGHPLSSLLLGLRTSLTF